MSAPISACLSCEGRCCTAYIVPLTGDDIWRIVQEQRLAPTLFVQRAPEPYPTSTGFVLRPGGPTYALALRHQYDRRNERPCIFLIQLRAGVRRCGIYTHRPLACQTYPMRLQPAGVAPREDLLCPRGSWADIAERPGPWRERLIRQDEAWDRYAAVVHAWNAAVQRRPADSGYVLDDYLAYLIAVYDDLASRADAAADATALNALAETWTARG